MIRMSKASIRVGFDISQVAYNGGVATYTKDLTTELSKIRDLEMVYFYSSLRKTYQGKLKNVKNYRLPPTLFEVLFNKIRNVPIEKFLGSMDIYHSSDWVQPPTKAKKVTTYHDVVPLKYPQWSHPKIVAVHKKRLELVKKEIDIVIAVSKTTKKDLMEISGIPEEKIVVIYEAAGDEFKPQSKNDILNFKKKYKLPDDFVLGIGGVGERRNLERVKRACQDVSLVITGQTIPVLTTEEMPLLYASASILLYPSLYEGFGLPILEAQACGTPVITSNISSMPEVAGDSAILVDPTSQENIKRQVKVLMEDEKLREDIINKGFKNVKRFSWKKAAEQTAEVYRNLVH
ncbi:MAG: glycosyltransferase family 1 protein [Candidatus Daviesbacteria bacterium]|nr:glycosyltransferase family 1 protein [Candidatus Daviesbacteria bacterium]